MTEETIPYAHLGNLCPHFEPTGDCENDDFLIEQIEIWCCVCDCDICREGVERAIAQVQIDLNPPPTRWKRK